MKTQPPKITIGTAPGGYSLVGFKEFEDWMLLHDPVYRAGWEQAQRHGMREDDRLKFMLAYMTTAKREVQDKLVEHHQNHARPHF